MVEVSLQPQMIKPLMVESDVEGQPPSPSTAIYDTNPSPGLHVEKTDDGTEVISLLASSSKLSDGTLASNELRSGFKIGPEDFTPLCVIGQGAFGRVLQVRGKFDNQVYAMKVISKKMLVKKNHVAYMKAERDILTKVDFPFVVCLNFSFQTEENLFLIMPFLSGGELFFHLRKQGLILEETARFYIAEMVLALEHLHSRGVVHRDLKPENVLLGGDGHICLTDFGLAKEMSTEENEEGRARTVCGTNEYMAPEMIGKKGYGKAVDWWSVGILMYEMMAGSPPFRAKTLKELNHKILHDKLSLPKWLSPEAHSIMRGFLERNVQKRLGNQKGTMFEIGGVTAVKNHRFFAKVDWQALMRKQVAVPFVPPVENDVDTRNFDEEFTKLELSISLVELEDLPGTQSDSYNGFSFIAPHFDLDSVPPGYQDIRTAAKQKKSLHGVGSGDEEEMVEPDLYSASGRKSPEKQKEKKKKKKSPNRMKSCEPPPRPTKEDAGLLVTLEDESREEVKASVEADTARALSPSLEKREPGLLVPAKPSPSQVGRPSPSMGGSGGTVKSSLRPTVPEFVPRPANHVGGPSPSPSPSTHADLAPTTTRPVAPVPQRPASISWSNVVKKPHKESRGKPAPDGSMTVPMARAAGTEEEQQRDGKSPPGRVLSPTPAPAPSDAPVEDEWHVVVGKKPGKAKASKK